MALRRARTGNHAGVLRSRAVSRTTAARTRRTGWRGTTGRAAAALARRAVSASRRRSAVTAAAKREVSVCMTGSCDGWLGGSGWAVAVGLQCCNRALVARLRPVGSVCAGAMEFGILGPLEVRRDGRVVALGGGKPRAVLAILLLQANRPLGAERLAAALWGDDAPAGAVRTVQVHVSRLRRALDDDDLLATTPAGYRLRVRPGELDVDRFERLLDEARRLLAPAALGGVADGGRSEREGEQPRRAISALEEALSFGGARHWLILPTSRSRSPRSRAWRISSSLRSNCSLMRSWLSAATPRWWRSSNGSSPITPIASGCGDS